MEADKPAYSGGTHHLPRTTVEAPAASGGSAGEVAATSGRTEVEAGVVSLEAWFELGKAPPLRRGGVGTKEGSSKPEDLPS